MLIRSLTTIGECRAAAALEREVWGYRDAQEAIPPSVMFVSLARGAILLGAFDDRNRLAGFVYSVPAIRSGQLTHWSHTLAVVAAARSTGVGRRLKVAQRDAAMSLGVDLIEWTYDPLQAMNAHFNFATLGIVVEEYAEDVYGDSSSPLHQGSPTDRFIAEWHLSRPHVLRRIASWGQPVIRDGSVAGAVLVNPAVVDGTVLSPGQADLAAEARRVLVEIPAAFSELQAGSPERALEWRMHTRRIFQAYFARGYRVVDFFLSREAGRGHYLLAERVEREDRPQS